MEINHMTLEEILTKYDQVKEDTRRFGNWSKLDELVEEIAQLATGTPLLSEEEASENIDAHYSYCIRR